MARGRKTGGKDFTKDEPRPGPGRPPIHPELVAVQPLGKENVARLIAQLWEVPIEELGELARSSFVPAGKAIMARILYAAWIEGDHQRINFILDRTIGKVKDVIESTHKLETLPSREEAVQILTADYAVLPPSEKPKLEDL